MQLPRAMRNRTLLVGDLLLIIVSVLGSFVLRLNFGERLNDFRWQMATLIAIALVVKPLIYYQFGLYRRIWVYASIQEVKLIALAVTSASVAMFAITTLIQLGRVFPEMPRAIVPIDWLASLFFVGGLRFGMRLLAESAGSPQLPLQGQGRQLRRVLVVGAGEAGALVVREMQKNARAGLQPTCLLDDDPNKQRQEIHGVPVVGRLEDIGRVITQQRIDEVIIAIPSAPGQVVRRVMEQCRSIGLPFRTIPSLNELIGGQVSVSRLREVEITDLLRRAPAQIDDQLVGRSLYDRRILVTGAGGSIGRELCRQIARWQPQELILVGHGENSIFETVLELKEDFPQLSQQVFIGDIRDTTRMTQIFQESQPQVVFHAAAHKHVPLMQANLVEAVTNNILGTSNIIQQALHFNVERLVMISSDKAVRPTSIMGATKRIAEMIVLEAAHSSGRAFSVVRFGNVLGSRGSIVPIFKRQIAAGGPITITHPEMERYFMTIPEAVHLVLQAAAMGSNGETFILNMGQQVRILDLANDLIRLSGLQPGQDIEIVFTGIRPGEKLSEALWDEEAQYHPTDHPDILQLAEDENLIPADLEAILEQLAELAQQGDSEAIIHLLDTLIPGAAVQSTPSPDMTAVV